MRNMWHLFPLPLLFPSLSSSLSLKLIQGLEAQGYAWEGGGEEAHLCWAEHPSQALHYSVYWWEMNCSRDKLGQMEVHKVDGSSFHQGY